MLSGTSGRRPLRLLILYVHRDKVCGRIKFRGCAVRGARYAFGTIYPSDTICPRHDMFRFAKRKGGNLPRQISIKIKSAQLFCEQRKAPPACGRGMGWAVSTARKVSAETKSRTKYITTIRSGQIQDRAPFFVMQGLFNRQ